MRFGIYTPSFAGMGDMIGKYSKTLTLPQGSLVLDVSGGPKG
jgi:hypothetical protein